MTGQLHHCSSLSSVLRFSARMAMAALMAGMLNLSIATDAWAQNPRLPTFNTLHSFTGGSDGAYPSAGLVVGKNGVLYGTTVYGGASAACPLGYSGAVFQMMPPTSPGGSWAQSVIYAFPASDHCFAYPLAAPTIGSNGELYGTTYFGGSSDVGGVYELTPPSSPGGAWTKTTLYSFSPDVGAPQNPAASVVFGRNGVLYGTVQFAGSTPNCPFPGQSYGCGGVYSLTPPATPGAAWTEQTLYVFNGADDGAVPETALAIGENGTLYGTTYAGGAGSACTGLDFSGPALQVQSTGCGTVFELAPPASPGGAWTETVLYNFTGGRDGGYPSGVAYRGGVLTGTVTLGGDSRNCGGGGCGGVFQLRPPSEPGDPWTESVIYSFTSVPDGLFPGSGVVIANDGTLYGTTRDGGDKSYCPQNPGCGVVFQLKPPHYPDTDWQEAVLHRFTSSDGWRPTAGVVIGKGGNLYGTTYLGGTSTNCQGGCGVVFQANTQH